MLDFWSGQKRIYAKLTPLTPEDQAHYKVTESALAEKRVPIFLCHEKLMDAARYTLSAFSFTGEKVGGIIEIEFCKSAFIVKAIKNTDKHKAGG